MQYGTEIPALKRLIISLEKAGSQKKAPIWTAVARILSKATRQRVAVNLNKLERLATKENSSFVVPGKVLSIGEVPKKKFHVAAYSFSKPALDKLEKAGCKATSITQLMQHNPTGSNVTIVV